MKLLPRQIVHQPAINRAKSQFSSSSSPDPFAVVQNPFNLSRRKIGVDHQPGFPADLLAEFRPLDFGTTRRGPAALPHNGIVNGPAALPVPNDGGLPLVGNSDGRDSLR